MNKQTMWRLALALVLLLALSSALHAAGQGPAATDVTYELGWWTIDGGGASSSGGLSELIGTSGQPDAGPLTGGGYELIGGFWGGAAPAPYPVYLPTILR